MLSRGVPQIAKLDEESNNPDEIQTTNSQTCNTPRSNNAIIVYNIIVGHLTGRNRCAHWILKKHGSKWGFAATRFGTDHNLNAPKPKNGTTLKHAIRGHSQS